MRDLRNGNRTPEYRGGEPPRPLPKPQTYSEAELSGASVPQSEVSQNPRQAEKRDNFKIGDQVTDGKRKGKVEEKDGKTFVRQLGTEAILPLSDKWEKTSVQKKLDDQKAKAEAKKAKLKPGKSVKNDIDADFEGTGKTLSDPAQETDKHYEVLSHDANVRMLMSDVPVEGFEKGKTSSNDVIKSYENVLNAVDKPTPIRTGRGNFVRKQARGFYKVNEEVIRLRTANNIPTAAHEIFHAAQKYLYGRVKGTDLKSLPIPVKKELVKMGKDLYGESKPAAGYGAEGWAEFGRHYLTSEDASRIAPETFKFFESEILPKHPEFAKALAEAKDTTTKYRLQGAENRISADRVKKGTPSEKLKDIKRAINHIPTQMVDEFTPLLRLTKDVERITGEELSPGNDPYKVASFLRGGASSTTHYFVFDGTLDFARNKVGPSLDEAFAPVKGKTEEFANYMWARRAQELWAEGINPGMTKADADTIVKLYDSDEFQLATSNLHKWNNDVLDYVRQSSPEMASVVDKIFAKNWQNYVPLMREFDDVDVKALRRINAAGGNPLKRIKGSGRRVKDIFPQMIANTEKLIAAAHRQKVMDTIVDLSKVEGLGHLIEEVPKDKIPTTFDVSQIKKQLEEMGAELPADINESLTVFTEARFPKGQDPIVPIMRD